MNREQAKQHFIKKMRDQFEEDYLNSQHDDVEGDARTEFLKQLQDEVDGSFMASPQRKEYVKSYLSDVTFFDEFSSAALSDYEWTDD
jgi:hypothetical protein